MSCSFTCTLYQNLLFLDETPSKEEEGVDGKPDTRGADLRNLQQDFSCPLQTENTQVDTFRHLSLHVRHLWQGVQQQVQTAQSREETELQGGGG